MAVIYNKITRGNSLKEVIDSNDKKSFVSGMGNVGSFNRHCATGFQYGSNHNKFSLGTTLQSTHFSNIRKESAYTSILQPNEPDTKNNMANQPASTQIDLLKNYQEQKKKAMNAQKTLEKVVVVKSPIDSTSSPRKRIMKSANVSVRASLNQSPVDITSPSKRSAFLWPRSGELNSSVAFQSKNSKFSSP
jgi:hypothetical protein